ncbi:MAG: hypothetical protein ACXWZT_10675, partial [Gaiellaceae bacterium]
QEELKAVCGTREDMGLRLGGLLFLLGLLLGRGLADVEPDPLELAGQLLDLGLVEVVLEGERLELGSLEVPTFLGTLDERLGLVGIKQFVQLILCQVSLSSPTL